MSGEEKKGEKNTNKKNLLRSGMKDSTVNLATAEHGKNETKKTGGAVAGGSPSGEFPHVLVVKHLRIFSLKLYSVQYEAKCHSGHYSASYHLRYLFSIGNVPLITNQPTYFGLKFVVFQVRKKFFGHIQRIINTTNVNQYNEE